MFKYDQNTALIVVDIQNDFALPTGALSVKNGDRIIPYVNSLIKEMQSKGSTIVYSQDWHPKHHISFKDQGGMWPSHCVEGTEGAEFHQDLVVDGAIFRKAFNLDEDSYSAFGGVFFEEDISLDAYLKTRGITKVVVVGLALDFCIKATALDAVKNGYRTLVDVLGTASVFPENDEQTKQEIINGYAWYLE